MITINDARPVAPPADQYIAGFWRRLVAFVVDALILGVAGALFGYFFYDTAVALGAYGRLAGLGVWLAYFALLDSNLVSGQSLGKMLLGVRLVARSGHTVSFGRAFVRALIFGLPYFLNGFFLPAGTVPGGQTGELVVGTALIFIVFGLGLSIVYLYIFNARTRQSLHDLITGTFVVRASHSQDPISHRTAAIHYVIVVVICALALGAPFLLQRYVAQAYPTVFAPQLDLQQALSNDPGVRSVQVVTQTMMWASGGSNSVSTSLVVTVIPNRPVNEDAEIVRIAGIVLKQRHDIMGQQQLIVRIEYGYDIGIASQWTMRGETETPGGWEKRIAGEPPAPNTQQSSSTFRL